MMTKFTDREAFIEEAKRRGLQILPQQREHKALQDEGITVELYVGIRQHNPQPIFLEDEHVDIVFGFWGSIQFEGRNEPVVEGRLFDTDDEYDDWVNNVTS